MIIFGAIRVVTTKNVVHAALWLVMVLAGVAMQYFVLAAEFVAATEVLVYIGAIVVLSSSASCSPLAKIGRDQELTNRHWAGGAFAAVALLGVMGYALLDSFGWTRTPLPADTLIDNVDGSNTQPSATRSSAPIWSRSRSSPCCCSPPWSEPSCWPARTRLRLMDDLLLNQFLLLGAVLFCIGVYGVISRRNAVLVLMSIELILNAVNINLIAFGAFWGSIEGAVFALFVIAIAAAEVGVGLAIVLLIYRNRKSVDLDEVAELKG